MFLFQIVWHTYSTRKNNTNLSNIQFYTYDKNILVLTKVIGNYVHQSHYKHLFYDGLIVEHVQIRVVSNYAIS